MMADAKIQKTVATFCSKMAKAKRAWDNSGGDINSWMSYYDKKDEARCELLDAIPQASRIGRLNQIIIDHPPHQWAIIICLKIQAIINGYSCADCNKTIQYPAIRCDDCAEAWRILQAERADVARILAGKKPKKQKRRVKRKLIKNTTMRRS